MALKVVSILFVFSLWLISCNSTPTTLPLATGTETATPTAIESPATIITETPPTMPTPLSASDQQALDAMLIQAAESGDTSAVLSLLEAGANINATDERGSTSVMAATHTHQVETVRTLIDAG